MIYIRKQIPLVYEYNSNGTELLKAIYESNAADRFVDFERNAPSPLHF